MRFEDAKRHYKNGKLTADEIRAVSGAAEAWLYDINQLSDKPLRYSKAYGISAAKTQEDHAWGGHYRHYSVLGARINIAEIDNLRINQAIDILNIIADLADTAVDVQALADAINVDTLETLIDDAISSGEASTELSDYYDIPGIEALVNESIEAGELVQSLDDYFDFEALALALQNNGDTSNAPDLTKFLRYQIPEQFESTISVQGAEVDETSIAYALVLPRYDKIKLGLSVKYLSLTTIDITKRIEDFEYDNINEDENQKQHQSFNADVGVLYQINERYALGAVIKNMLPQDFSTSNGNTIKYRPLMRMGVAYSQEDFRLAVDVDLTKNEPLGYDPDKQYIGLGIEWNVKNNITLRTGFRNDLHAEEQLYSIGLGLETKSMYIDLAAARSKNNEELGVALQVGVIF